MAFREQSYLILLALAEGRLHGYGVIKAVRTLSDDRVRLGPGTLYGALDRLSAEGLVRADGEEVVDGRHRRYYALTGLGEQAAVAETQRLTDLARTARRRVAGLSPSLGGGSS